MQEQTSASPDLVARVFDGHASSAVASLTGFRDAVDGSADAFGYLDISDPDGMRLTELATQLNAPDLAHRASESVGHLPMVTGCHVRLHAQRVQLETPAFQMTIANLHVYVLPRVIILDHDDTFDTTALRARFDTESKHRDQGVGWLLWLLLDQLLSESSETLETLDDELEDIEDTLLAPGTGHAAVQARTYQLRKSTAKLRRALLPLRDGIDALLRREADCISTGLFPLFQGLYDRAVRQVEWADSLRDLVTALSDTQLAAEGNRLNVIMKKVTSWAAIIALPAGVTGFYGQNLPYPGINTEWGFWTSTALMIGGCATLYITFKHKDWL